VSLKPEAVTGAARLLSIGIDNPGRGDDDSDGFVNGELDFGTNPTISNPRDLALTGAPA
jgi:hypothetical protein